MILQCMITISQKKDLALDSINKPIRLCQCVMEQKVRWESLERDVSCDGPFGDSKANTFNYSALLMDLTHGLFLNRIYPTFVELKI